MFDLAQLNCFVAAAEEMHFGRAAIRLNVTQPTLSRQIDALERQLKVKLFDRTHRTVQLSAAGRIFLPEVKRILVQIDSATNLARRTWGGEVGVIRLGFTATAAFSYLPQILSQSARILPDVKILLKECTSAIQKDALLADILDVAILRPPVDKSMFGILPMKSERFIAALHADDPRAGKKKLRLQDFNGQNFIMYSADGAGYSFRILTAMFEKAQVHPIIVYHLDQNHTMLSLVSAGLGAALVPESLAKLSFPNVIFKRVDLEPAIPLELFMAWLPQNKNPALAPFLAVCRPIFAL